jgi:menaquinone-specific isochorismate synthase
MTTPVFLGAVHDIASAKEALAGLIERSFESAAPHADKRRVIRLEVPIVPVDLLAWLRLQGNRSRGYWADREKEFVIAGRGAADVITADAETDYEELFERLRAGIAGVHPNLRYYGGMRFNHQAPVEARWRAFGSYRFVLPRFELLNRGAQTYLACNAVFEGAEAAHALQEELHEELAAMAFPDEEGVPAPPRPISREDRPNEAQWAALVERSLADFEQSSLEKVVLARETRLQFAEALDPLDIFAHLIAANDQAYHFCFQPLPGHAFMGASPERLYKRQGRFVQSEAVAGTCGRGLDDGTDANLGSALLGSDKDQREHRFVVDALHRQLNDRCHAVHCEDEAALLKLPRCQHLYTRLEGILSREFKNDAELLRALPPTPAVGGHPRGEALEWIAQEEPFDRGWYAGPIGWVSQDAAEFAVGIRAGLVDCDTLSLYAGAGLVAGSDPRDEWAEVEQKMAGFMAMFADNEA